MVNRPWPYSDLGHDLWVWVLEGIGPLHSDQVAPDLHLAAHQPAAGLSCCFVIFILQKAKAPVLLFVYWLKVQYDIIESLCGDSREKQSVKAI